MDERKTRFTLPLLGAALGAYGSATARIGAQVLSDLQLQQTAAVAALGFATGPLLFALRAEEHERESQARARAWLVTLCALCMSLGAAVWLRVARTLPATDLGTCGAALLLAIPLFVGAYASVASTRVDGSGLGGWLGGAGVGASAAMLGIEAIGVERVLAQSCLLAGLVAVQSARAPVSKRGDALWSGSGAIFLSTLALSLWAPSLLQIPPQPPPLGEQNALREGLSQRGLRLVQRNNGWDGFGHLEAFELVDARGHSTDAGVLLRDSTLLAPLVRGGGVGSARGTGKLAALCENTLLAEPYATPRARVLIAGIGGGLELQCALYRGASGVDVAEPSGALRAAVRGALDHFLGEIGSSPRVRYHATSARTFLRLAHTAPYDLIVLAAVGAKHPLPPGALPVPEALLETDRGFAELISALAPDGMLSATVQGEPAALRLAATALSALRLRGEQHPQDLIAVHQSGGAYGLLVRRTPFALDALLSLHARKKKPSSALPDPLLQDLLRWPQTSPELRYTPGAGFANRFGALVARAGRPDLPSFQSSYAFDVGVPSDDRPLFYEQTRRDRSDAWLAASPYRALVWLTLLAPAIALAAGWLAARRRQLTSSRDALTLICIGAAQPLALAFLVHVLSLCVERPQQVMALAATSMLFGAGAGIGTGKRARNLPRLMAHTMALVAFALIAVGLGAMLESASRANAAFVLALGLVATFAVSFALALPTGVMRPNAAAVRKGARAWELAWVVLGAAAAVPSASTLVLFAGYPAVSVAVAALLALPVLLSLRAPTRAL